MIKLNPLTLLVKYGLIDRGNGTIYDTRTNLTWQQDSSLVPYNWDYAHKYCEESRLAGYRDWRLPTIEELKTLIEMEHIPTICPVFRCNSDWYWSSTYVNNTGIWLVYFTTGFINHYNYRHNLRLCPCRENRSIVC
jgi:hypothetical protein